MYVSSITAEHVVSLKAQMSIMDYLPDGYTIEEQLAPKIITDTLILESLYLGIGSHANELHVNTRVSGTGTITAIGGSGDVLINEMVGDMYIESVDMHKGRYRLPVLGRQHLQWPPGRQHGVECGWRWVRAAVCL